MQQILWDFRSDDEKLEARALEARSRNLLLDPADGCVSKIELLLVRKTRNSIVCFERYFPPKIRLSNVFFFRSMEIPIVYEVSSTKKPNPEPESTTSPTDMVHFEFPTPTPR